MRESESIIFIDILYIMDIIGMSDNTTGKKMTIKQSYSLGEYRDMVAQNKGSDGKEKRNSKFNAVRTTYEGISFDSKGECERYKQLRFLESAGQISDLKLKVVHKLEINGVHICNYESDFEYVDTDGTQIVEDFKGFRTKEFIIKSKLMLAVKGIKILETGVRGKGYGRS